MDTWSDVSPIVPVRSRRSCTATSYEQWLAEDVHIEECESLQLHHLYRVMDFLEAHKEALEQGAVLTHG